MPSLTIHKSAGGTGDTLELQDTVFGGEVNTALLHQAVLRQQADRRQGTHDSQTRAEVSRTTKKVWRQKGTGRARQGSRKGPHWTGGGVAFGPHPRDHSQDLPRKMRAAAIRSAFAAKTSAGQLSVIDGIVMQAPSTKQLARLLGEVTGGAKGKTLLLLDGPQPNVQLSARNLPGVTTATVENVNAYDLMRHANVVLTVTAARRIEARYSGGDEASVEAADVAPLPAMEKRAPVAAVKTAAAKTATKSAAKKSASKSATKAAAKSADDSEAEETTEDAAPATKTARKRATKSAAKSAESEE
ncbi:MAG TPA: 50S ribosomal protein L4 [Chloroflexota bacterium]|nr:50S ribosomal protein L4 [Chloroflexota bacterium]